MKKVKTPKPTEKVLAPKRETVSATPIETKMLDGQPIGNAASVAPSNEGIPASVCGGDTCHEQFAPVEGAHPVRMRHNKPEGGSHTTSETNATPPKPHDVQDPDKVAKFSRGGQARLPHFTTSPRDWNSTGADAPNKEQK